MSRVIEMVPKGAKTDDSSTADTAIKALAGLGGEAMGLVKQLLELPLSNPTMAAVIGIVLNDILGHKVNWVTWTHQEYYCTNCNVWVSLFDWITGVHLIENIEVKTVDGIITASANLQLAGVILGSFGIAAAGQIIADISQITKIVGGAPTDAMVTPSMKFLSKGGAKSALATLTDIEATT